MKKLIAISILMLVLAGCSSVDNVREHESKQIGGDLPIEKVLPEPLIKNLSIKPVVISKGSMMPEKLEVNINLHNQFASQGDPVMSCDGRDFISCLDHSVNEKLRKYNIKKVSVSVKGISKKYKVNLNKIE